MRWLLFLPLVACEPLVTDTVDPSTDATDVVDDTDVVDTDDPAGPAFEDLPRDTWTYTPVDGMVCGNGKDTGIGVNPGSNPNKLLVFFAGGGACWDTTSCHVLNAAVNLETGWGEAKMSNEVRGLDNSGLFDRTDADNPYRDATWIYVPYCTGDLHAGDSERQYLDWKGVVHHKGDANVRAVVSRLTQEVPSATSLWLVGVSAGGYGVQLQMDRFADAWPSAELAALADCSPMVQPWNGRYGVWRQAWSMRQPPDCTDCDTSLTAALSRQVAAYPDSRIGLTAYDNDGTITIYTGYPLGGLPNATYKIFNDVYAPSANAQAFVVVGNEHTMLGHVGNVKAAGGETLTDWYWAWARGGEAFVDVK